MKTNYTLIHYLSNGSDYCRGCYMGGSSSDFSIGFFNNEEDIIEAYAQLLVDEHFEEDVFGGHEYTVLINGVNYDNSYDEERDDTDPSFYRIIDGAENRSKVLIAAKRLELDQSAKIKAEKDKELEKQRILAEIAHLQSKL